MGSFDKSFYDLLNKYKSITEKYTITDENGNTATVDELPPGVTLAPQSGTTPTAVPATATGNAAAAPQAGSTAQPAGEITQQQKDLFQKMHGTSYNPNSTMDKTKMGQLQSAGSEVGYDDVNKLTNAAYAKQYGDSEKGKAYAKQAGTTQPTQTQGQQDPTTITPVVKPATTPGGTPSINVTPSWVARSEGRPAPLLGNKPQSPATYAQQSANPLNIGRPAQPTGKPTVYSNIQNNINRAIPGKLKQTVKPNPVA